MAELSRVRRRTDDIRQRHIGRSHQVKVDKDRRKHNVEMRVAPPVMARGASLGVPHAGIKRSKNTRRRFDVALAAQGAEVRLPSLPQIRVGWRVTSFVMVAFLGFTAYMLWTSPRFRVDTANVTGLQRLTSTQVNAALGLNGKQIFMLDPNSMENKLINTFPEFSSVAVGIELPQSVAVTVTERIPVLIWRQDGNTNLVDVDGMTFPLREGANSDNLPVIEAAGNPPPLAVTGSITSTLDTPALDRLTSKLPYSLSGSKPKPLLSPEMVSAILLISSQATKGEKLVYDPVHGLGWKDPRGWTAFVGDASDIDMKLLVYKAIILQLTSKKIKPSLVSVEYLHAPYYRMEKSQ